MSKEEPIVDDTLSEEESDNNSTPEEPTTPLDTNQSIPIVTEWLAEVTLNDMSVNGSTTEDRHSSQAKVNSPKEFTGSRN